MHEISPQLDGGSVVPSGRAATRGSHLETRTITLPPGVSRADARQRIADEAEYGKWELARVVLYRGGARRIWLRRRSMRVRRTDAA